MIIDTKAEALPCSGSARGSAGKGSGAVSWAAYPWRCALCAAAAPSPSLAALRAHCRTQHRKCAAFKCADCELQSHSFHHFVEHVRTHRRGLRFVTTNRPRLYVYYRQMVAAAIDSRLQIPGGCRRRFVRCVLLCWRTFKLCSRQCS